MTYIIPSIIAAVIVFFFARRLNKLENEESVLAMDTSGASDSPLQTVKTNNVEPPSEPASETSSHDSQAGQDTSENQEEPKYEPDNTAQTVELIVEILKNLGCQPVVEGRQTVNVKYQGENFQFYADGFIVNIYDLPWTHFNIKDPHAHTIREAINKTNFSTLPMVLMMAPDEDGKVNVLSRYQTILHPSCTVNEDYVHYILDCFFSAQREVRGNFSDLSAKQENPSRNRRPVGFDTGTE